MFGKIYILLLAYFVGIFCTEICLKQTGVCLFVFHTACDDIASKCMENNTCCITDPAQNCDNILGDSSCESNAAKCNIDAVSKVCPKTCKTCVPIGNPPPPCVDKVGPNGQSDCAKDAYLCNNAQYFDLMTQQCPKTCNRCPAVAPPPAGNSPPPPPCVDKIGPNGQSDCAKDAYLCNNAQYFDLMTQQCPKTCGRC